jgi:hypothetical protein
MKYELDDFNEIYIEDIFEVVLIQDTICKIELVGGSNLLPDVEFNVSDNKLNISNNYGGNWSRNYERIKVYLSLKNITLLRLNESSNISCIDTLTLPKLTVYSINDYSDISLTLNCDNFYIVNSSTSGGYFTIIGEGINSGIWSRGSCIIDAQKFETVKTNIKNESIGNCYAGICQTLEVEILNSGNVYYKGNPETITYINEQAKEQLIKLD